MSKFKIVELKHISTSDTALFNMSMNQKIAEGFIPWTKPVIIGNRMHITMAKVEATTEEQPNFFNEDLFTA